MKRLLILLASIAIFSSCSTKREDIADSVLPTIEAQTLLMLESNDKQPTLQSPKSVANGEMRYTSVPGWCAGFFPGTLWYIHALSSQGDESEWATQAKRYCEHMSDGQYITNNHDIGFVMMSSYGNGYRLNGREEFLPEIIQSARTQIKRFRPSVGAIQSWGKLREPSQIINPQDSAQCMVIIDNMMNLELLFEATALTGDSTFYDIAVSHADVTLRNHFREDNSSYHVVNYSLATGEPLQKRTHQGWSDSSAWSRGQAWGLYGYTMCYRYTKDSRYLEQAKKIASLLIKESAAIEDGIYYWDFNCPRSETTPRDASATAITASALYELYGYTSCEEQRSAADRMLRSLSSAEYLSSVGDNHHFLLKHSTGHLPGGYEIDAPLNYADYYYVEALYRQREVNAGRTVGYVAARLEPTNDREQWLEAMDKISRPLLEASAQGRLRQDMPVNKLGRGSVPSLEAIGRTIAGIGPWLGANVGDAAECELRSEYQQLVIKTLQNMVDPQSPDYIIFDHTKQPLVDAAFLVHGLLRCRSTVWDRLDKQSQQRLVDELKKTNTIQGGMNNWLLFSAMVQIGLKEFGGEWDERRVHYAIDNMDSWYKGDGTYGDGVEFHDDYYNSFVIHPMMLFCSEYLVERGYRCSVDPAMIAARMGRYAEIQERHISPEGAYPIIGRSISYRFGAFHALSDAAYRHLLPYWVKPAQVRSALTAVIARQISAPATFDKDGWLNVGFYGEQPSLGESYISIGSLYLANFVFIALALPESDSFWSDPYTEWTSLRAYNGRYVELDLSLEKRLSPPAYLGAVKRL